MSPFWKFLITVFGYLLLRRLMGAKIKWQIVTYIFVIQVIMLPSLSTAIKNENFVVLENIVEFISVIGRPRTDSDKLEQARILYQNSDKSSTEICKIFGFSRRTLFTYMQKIKS